MAGLLDLCETLSLFAVATRYPGDLPSVSVADAQAYMAEAETLRETLLERILK